jgi:hypothetical protein
MLEAFVISFLLFSNYGSGKLAIRYREHNISYRWIAPEHASSARVRRREDLFRSCKLTRHPRRRQQRIFASSFFYGLNKT